MQRLRLTRFDNGANYTGGGAFPEAERILTWGLCRSAESCGIVKSEL